MLLYNRYQVEHFIRYVKLYAKNRENNLDRNGTSTYILSTFYDNAF